MTSHYLLRKDPPASMSDFQKTWMKTRHKYTLFFCITESFKYFFFIHNVVFIHNIGPLSEGTWQVNESQKVKKP